MLTNGVIVHGCTGILRIDVELCGKNPIRVFNVSIIPPIGHDKKEKFGVFGKVAQEASEQRCQEPGVFDSRRSRAPHPRRR